MQKSKIDKIDRALGLLFLLTIIYLFVWELSKHYGFDKIQTGDDIATVNHLMGKPDYIERGSCNSPCKQRFIYANWFTLGVAEFVIELDVRKKVSHKTVYVSG